MRIVIVGGVAAGMSAAARARRLDEEAEIIVLEKGSYVSFANCGLPYYVSGEIEKSDDLVLQTAHSMHDALTVDVKVGHEVVGLDGDAKTVRVKTATEEFDLPYDALVLAPGADAIRPDIPGIDSPRVVTLRTVHDAVQMRAMVDQGAKSAVVLGAGFIGLEAAEGLRDQGLDVTVVELGDHVLPPFEAELTPIMRSELEKLGIKVREKVCADAIEVGEDQDTVVLADGSRIPADLVVLSTGVRPATRVFEDAGVACERGAILVDEHGKTSIPGVWAGGDAVASKNPVTGDLRPVPLAGPANRAGRLIADSIIKGDEARKIPEPLGTAVVRVGDLTGALTGANRQTLDAAGIKYHTLNLHPTQHVTYFPGAREMHLVVHFEDGTGRILGAQGVGQKGIDKRIDVFATAIRGGLAINDLIDTDLAYSPPYGAAKDGVNMAGMMGENVLDGVTDLWYSEELPEAMEDCLIVDCRRPDEYAGGHLPGALNVPHTQVRGRIEEIREAAAGRPVRVHCRSGMRSYIAERILKQEGFDVKNLSGGMLTLKEAMAGGVTPPVKLVFGDARQ